MSENRLIILALLDFGKIVRTKKKKKGKDNIYETPKEILIGQL